MRCANLIEGANALCAQSKKDSVIFCKQLNRAACNDWDNFKRTFVLDSQSKQTDKQARHSKQNAFSHFSLFSKGPEKIVAPFLLLGTCPVGKRIMQEKFRWRMAQLISLAPRPRSRDNKMFGKWGSRNRVHGTQRWCRSGVHFASSNDDTSAIPPSFCWIITCAFSAKGLKKSFFFFAALGLLGYAFENWQRWSQMGNSPAIELLEKFISTYRSGLKRDSVPVGSKDVLSRIPTSTGLNLLL